MIKMLLAGVSVLLKKAHKFDDSSLRRFLSIQFVSQHRFQRILGDRDRFVHVQVASKNVRRIHDIHSVN
jgi:hypothetical protein